MTGKNYRYWDNNGNAHEWPLGTSLPESANIYRADFINQFVDAVNERWAVYFETGLTLLDKVESGQNVQESSFYKSFYENAQKVMDAYMRATDKPTNYDEYFFENYEPESGLSPKPLDPYVYSEYFNKELDSILFPSRGQVICRRFWENMRANLFVCVRPADEFWLDFVSEIVVFYSVSGTSSFEIYDGLYDGPYAFKSAALFKEETSLRAMIAFAVYSLEDEDNARIAHYGNGYATTQADEAKMTYVYDGNDFEYSFTAGLTFPGYLPSEDNYQFGISLFAIIIRDYEFKYI